MDKLHTRILRNGWLFFHYLPLVFTPSKSTTWHEHILDPASVYFFHLFLLAFQKTAVIRRQSVPFPTTIHSCTWVSFTECWFPCISKKNNSHHFPDQVHHLSSLVSHIPPGLPTCSGSLKSPSNLGEALVPTPIVSAHHPKILGSSAEDPGPTVNKAPCTPLVKIRVFKPRPLRLWWKPEAFVSP